MSETVITENAPKALPQIRDWVPLRAWRRASELPPRKKDDDCSHEVLIYSQAGFIAGYYCFSTRDWWESYQGDKMQGGFKPLFWMALPDKPEIELTKAPLK